MPARVVPPPRRRVSWMWIALSILALLLLLWGTGGLTKINNLAVRQALLEGNDSVAANRLQYSRWLGAGSAETEFLTARLARHRGDFDAMLRMLQAASRLGYSAEMVAREQSLAKAQIGQFDEKLEADMQAWLLEGVDPQEVIGAYANGLAASSRFQEANQILAAWAGDFPRDPRPLFRQGRILEHQRRAEEALAKYQAAQKIAPQFAPACFSSARLLLEQRKVDEALTAFESCPGAADSLAVQTSIAVCKKAQAKLEEAQAMLERVMQHTPDEIVAAYTELQEPNERLIPAVELGKIESDSGRFEQAKRWLEQAIEFNSRDMEARYALAVTLRGLGEKELAEKEFDYVKRTREALANVNVYWDRVDSNPQDTEARLALAKILLEHESKRSGLYWIKSILQYDPANPEAVALLKAHAEESDQSPSAAASP